MGEFPVSHICDGAQNVVFSLECILQPFQYDEEKEKELERSRKKKRLDALEAQWLVSSISDTRPCW